MNALRRSMFPPPLLKKLRSRRRYSARRTKPLASACILTAALRRWALSHCTEKGEVENQKKSAEGKEQRVREVENQKKSAEGQEQRVREEPGTSTRVAWWASFFARLSTCDNSPVWCVSSRTWLFGRRGMPARRRRRCHPPPVPALGWRVGRLGTPRKT